jgi:hypothetical protein
VGQEVVAFSRVQLVGLLVDDKDEVGWELVRLLVALVRERDLGPLLPPGLYVDR